MTELKIGGEIGIWIANSKSIPSPPPTLPGLYSALSQFLPGTISCAEKLPVAKQMFRKHLLNQMGW